MHTTQPETFQFEGNLLKALQDHINSLATILENMGKRRIKIENTEQESFDQLREQVKNIRDHTIEEQRKLTQLAKPKLLLASPQ